MTNEERRLALYCLKANSNLHGEVCEKCSQYPECDHFIQDNVMEELIEALEQEPCEDKIIEWKKDFKEYVNSLSMPRDDYKGIMEYIDELPVASQEPCENAINIQAAIDIVRHECGEWKGLAKEIVKQFNGLPPVQPKYNPDEWCKTCSEYNQEKHCCPRYNNVIRNAVEEMKQSCEDAVSREDAIGAVANLFEMSEYPHPYPQGKPIRLREIKEKLKQLPPVQPKIKTGQWFLLDECSNSGYYCSECHKKLVKEGWSGTVKKIKFCPNCGCRMVKPQESEDKE